jgi:hypothetical protein
LNRQEDDGHWQRPHEMRPRFFCSGELVTNGRPFTSKHSISSCDGRHSLGERLGRCGRPSSQGFFLFLACTRSMPLSAFWAASSYALLLACTTFATTFCDVDVTTPLFREINILFKGVVFCSKSSTINVDILASRANCGRLPPSPEQFHY